MSNLQVVMVCILLTLNNNLVTYIDPTLEPYVDEQFHMGSAVVGMIFFAGSMVYMLLCPVGSLLAKKVYSYRLLLFLGSLLNGFAMLLIGPSTTVFGIKDPASFWPFLGEGVMQLGAILFFVPVLPEIMDTLQKIYKDLPEELIGDISSALYNCFFALGATIGPCVSGFIVKAF